MLLEVCNAHCPIRTLRVSSKKAEWITEEYLELRQKSLSSKCLADSTQSSDHHRRANNLWNKLNNLAAKHKSQYFHEVIKNNTNNSRQIWKTLKTLLPRKGSNFINPTGIEQTQNIDITNRFNNHVSSIGRILDSMFNRQHFQQIIIISIILLPVIPNFISTQKFMFFLIDQFHCVSVYAGTHGRPVIATEWATQLK